MVKLPAKTGANDSLRAWHFLNRCSTTILIGAFAFQNFVNNGGSCF